MEILLATFGIVLLFIGLSIGIKRLCYQYIKKQNSDKVAKGNNK